MARKTTSKKKPAKKKPARKKAPRRKRVTPIPEDFPTLSAYLTVSDMRRSIELYQKAFGFRMLGEPMRAGRQIVHAVLGYGGGAVMLGPPMPDGSHATPKAQQVTGQAFGLYAYVKDVDAHHRTAKRFKGLQVTAPVDTFWGDRMYDVVDRDGHRFTFASRKALPTPEEMDAAMKAMLGG